MAELKPCPFCGEQMMFEVRARDHGEKARPYGYRWTAEVVCLRCFARACSHGFEGTEETAIRRATEAWNRRVKSE